MRIGQKKVEVPDTTIDEEYLGYVVQSAYEIPKLAGYGPFWELDEDELQAHTRPGVRMLRRASPATRAFLLRIIDPLALLGAVAICVGKRMDMTRDYMAMLKIEAEQRAREAALGRSEQLRTREAAYPPPPPPASPNGHRGGIYEESAHPDARTRPAPSVPRVAAGEREAPPPNQPGTTRDLSNRPRVVEDAYSEGP